MPLPYPCVLHERAQEEYINAYEWYETKREGLGEEFMDYVERKLNQIAHHPEFYVKKHGNFREAKVQKFPYLIVYEFFKNTEIIHIAAIYHVKRNPKLKYRRRKK